MSSFDGQPSDSCHGGAGTTGQNTLGACACCMALAQVRMPMLVPPVQQGAESAARQTAPLKKKKTVIDLFFPRATESRSKARNEQKSGSDDKDAETLGWEDELTPKTKGLWQGLDGIAVTLFGIVLPSFLFLAMCMAMPKRITLVLLNHPLETIAEMILLLALPITNYIVWSALCSNKFKVSRVTSGVLGAATASALLLAGVCIAGMFFGGESMIQDSGTTFVDGFSWLALLSLAGAASTAFVIHRVRATREFVATKRQVVTCASVGALIAVGTFIAAEARPWLIRYAEHEAVSHSKTQSKQGLALLRQLYPERELHMECADPRAAGLCGLFIPIKPGAQRQLYFAITGKPYSFHETNKVDLSSMPDDYVQNNIVGDVIDGLSLARSTMVTNLHPKTMSANTEWTFVFKNDTGNEEEVRAQIALPVGAVVNGITTWTKGQTMDATFFASGKIEGVSGNADLGHSSPATVADLGHGRVLMHAYPVPPEGEYKVRISIVSPLGPDGATSASLTIPRFGATNFSLDGEHQVTVQSPNKIMVGSKLFKSNDTAGKFIVTGAFTGEYLKSAAHEINVARNASAESVAVIDTLATKMAREEQVRLVAAHKQNELQKVREIADLRELRDRVLEVHDGARAIDEQIEAIRRSLGRNLKGSVLPRFDVMTVERISAAAPEHLVVVLDGSATTAQYVTQIRTALEHLPAGITTSLIIASHENEDLAKPLPLKDALQNLKEQNFAGGQDNLKWVVKAAELAGRSKRGAVLWIHGPQPLVNNEIYIMSPYVHAPAFYELALDTADIDTSELFGNHPEVGPFSEVPHHSKNIADDLTAFVSRWTPGNSSYGVNLIQTDRKPQKLAKLSKQEEYELLLLHANQQCQQLLAAKHLTQAAVIAARYGFVSPVSYANVDPNRQNRDADGGLVSGMNGAFQSATSYSTGSNPESIDGSVAPTLQGATNGTIGPQGGDATVIEGVNTAGTVRVNNLANLEALLNIIANLCEVTFAVCGAVLFLCGLIQGGTVIELMGQEVEFTRGQRLMAGAMLVMVGLMTPGIINFFVASARDANLFS